MEAQINPDSELKDEGQKMGLALVRKLEGAEGHADQATSVFHLEIEGQNLLLIWWEQLTPSVLQGLDQSSLTKTM
jgi:hypothetical protein